MNMETKSHLQFSSKIGLIELKMKGEQLFSLVISEKSVIEQKSAIPNNKIIEQLSNYFFSACSFASISCSPNGTKFEKSVWQALSAIPLGETRTYGDLAKKLNSSPRAVGNACRKNPIQIVIPCHRVVSANGLGGYAGETTGKQINIKTWLLKHEGVEV